MFGHIHSNLRFFDDPDTPDTGNGLKPIVDMGACEYQVHVAPVGQDDSYSICNIETLTVDADSEVLARNIPGRHEGKKAGTVYI